MSSVDCDGEVQQDDITDAQVLVSCLGAMGIPYKFSPRQRTQFYKWSEVIDFGARTRWRTSKAFEGRFTESGIPVAVMRGRQAQLVILLAK